jgi:hypothetical protein
MEGEVRSSQSSGKKRRGEEKKGKGKSLHLLAPAMEAERRGELGAERMRARVRKGAATRE